MIDIDTAMLVALRDKKFTRQQAARKLRITVKTFRRLIERYGIEWPQLCRYRHEETWIVIGNRRRCKQCYEAQRERDRRRARFKPSRPWKQRVDRGLDDGDVDRVLAQAVALETAMPWERRLTLDS